MDDDSRQPNVLKSTYFLHVNRLTTCKKNFSAWLINESYIHEHDENIMRIFQSSRFQWNNDCIWHKTVVLSVYMEKLLALYKTCCIFHHHYPHHFRPRSLLIIMIIIIMLVYNYHCCYDCHWLSASCYFTERPRTDCVIESQCPDGTANGGQGISHR